MVKMIKMYLFDDLFTHLEKGFQVFFSCKTGEGIFADGPTLETNIPGNEHIVLANINLKKMGGNIVVLGLECLLQSRMKKK